MLWETLGSVLVGLAAACACLRWLHRRLPSSRLVLVTGPTAALFGGLLTRTVIGPGQLLTVLFGALAVAAALLSLLVGPPAAQVRRSAV
ncbi:hypothetical protein [Streptomyces sp. TP-A0874]|uniref:hypothetical protein n=1 Tax=Streptomyces sp. TP-A0874 TaxID=549819 RepID=UPI000853A1E0|nr:hypothetical protein [Streptomyces sp. TP-A0874]